MGLIHLVPVLLAYHARPVPFYGSIGGWWTRPHNWKSNTAVACGLIGLMTWGVWRVSAEREVRQFMNGITAGVFQADAFVAVST